MSEQPTSISLAFQTFANDALQKAQAWAEAVQALGQASALDPKTQVLGYLAVLRLVGLTARLI